MSTQIVINGTTFELPQQGDSSPWGTELSDLLQALADAATANVGPGDILPSTFVLTNNQSTPAAITGLLFNQAQIRGAEISYSVDVSTSSTEVTENGKLFINYDSTTNTWSQSQFSNGVSGIVFSVANGQVEYTLPNFSGTNFNGKLGFRAVAFEQ